MKEKIFIYRYWLAGATVILSLFIFYGSRLSVKSSDSTQPEQEEWYVEASTFEEPAEESSSGEQQILVDVKGAVACPGVYEVDTGMRIWDVLKLAGGMKETADEKQINLSQRLEDQMVIYIPEKGENIELPANHGQQNSDNSHNGVDLNTADEQELMTLSGIGEKKAEEIIRYREENGKFKSVDELANISGIGEKTLEKLREFIFVS